MTLRLIRSGGPSEVWYAYSGAMNVGTIDQVPGGGNRGRWKWSITRLYEPGWNFCGGGETQHDAMEGLGRQFRNWLAFAGLEESEEGGSLDAPFSVEDCQEDCKRVRTPGGLHVGFVRSHHDIPKLIWMPRNLFWQAWVVKFNDKFPQHAASGATIEEAVAGIAVGFRNYLALANLRERPFNGTTILSHQAIGGPSAPK